MLTRREFTGALACRLIAAELPKAAITIGPPGAPVPAAFSNDGCVFSCAYAGCPDPATFRATLVSGRFPHSRPQEPILVAVPEAAASVFVSATREDSPFDRSARVSLALRHPRLPRGKTFDFPVSTVDVAPTMLGLSGIAIPPNVHGRDLSRWVLTGRGERPESIYAEGQLGTDQAWRMVVRGLDKIVVRPNLDLLHLFNLGDDPTEEHDLIHEIGYQLKIDELKALVAYWKKRTSDGMDRSGLKQR